MSKARQDNSKISRDMLINATNLLLVDLREAEEEILAAHKKNKKKTLAESSDSYKAKLQRVAARLREIAVLETRYVNVKHVKSYKKTDQAPADYQHYANVLQNITDLIQQDILFQESADQAIWATERWLYIWKLSFEQHNFLTAAAILYAITSAAVIRSNVEEKISDMGKAIFAYAQKIYTKQSTIFALQGQQFRNGNKVIPMMSALASMLDGVSNQPDDLVLQNHADLMSAYYISAYEAMQKAADVKVKKARKQIYTDLVRIPNADLLDSYLQQGTAVQVLLRKKKYKIDTSKLAQQVGLYSDEDLFYLHRHHVTLLSNELYEYGQHNQLNPVNQTVCNTTRSSLLDNKKSFKDKLDELNQLLALHRKAIKSSLLKLLTRLQADLQALVALRNKEVSLEPAITEDARVNVSEPALQPSIDDSALKLAISPSSKNESDKSIVASTSSSLEDLPSGEKVSPGSTLFLDLSFSSELTAEFDALATNESMPQRFIPGDQESLAKDWVNAESECNPEDVQFEDIQTVESEHKDEISLSFVSVDEEGVQLADQKAENDVSTIVAPITRQPSRIQATIDVLHQQAVTPVAVRTALTSSGPEDGIVRTQSSLIEQGLFGKRAKPNTLLDSEVTLEMKALLSARYVHSARVRLGAEGPVKQHSFSHVSALVSPRQDETVAEIASVLENTDKNSQLKLFDHAKLPVMKTTASIAHRKDDEQRRETVRPGKV